MTARIGRGIIAAVATLLISSFATPASAQDRCSLASLEGSYAFRVEGTNVSNPYLPPGPFAAVGRNTYDGKGGMKGTILVSANGAMIPATYTGSYTLGADCTGTKSAVLNIGLRVDFYFLVDSNLRGIQMIATQAGPTAPTLTGGLTISGGAHKQFSNNGNED